MSNPRPLTPPEVATVVTRVRDRLRVPGGYINGNLAVDDVLALCATVEALQAELREAYQEIAFCSTAVYDGGDWTGAGCVGCGRSVTLAEHAAGKPITHKPSCLVPKAHAYLATLTPTQEVGS